jgi:FAD synthase
MHKSFTKVMGAAIGISEEVIKSHRSLEVRNADMDKRAKGADVLTVEQLRQELDFVEQRNLMQQYYKSYLKET